jgi:RNA polymerase sigma-70 factor (ECF subfamily)
MNDRSTASHPEELLLHVKWVRRIAAHLVVDAARADDLAQQTLLTALAQPPKRADHPRAWLASVARSLARKMHRSDERRARHESVVAPREPSPPVHEVVAQAQIQRDVVDAVLALDEPYRTALLLRFFENRPPRAIAKETQVPVETVRTRVKRGLELLRAELVQRRGRGGSSDVAANRDASAWAVALVGLLDAGMRRAVRRALLAKSVGAGAATLGASTLAGAFGVLAMTTKLKLAAAALVVAASAFTIVKLTSSSRLPPHDGVASATRGSSELAAPAHANAPALPSPAGASQAAERSSVPLPIEKPAPLPATRVLEGIVVDAQGDPVENAVVLLQLVEHGKSEIGSLPELCQNAEDLLHERDFEAKQGHRQHTTSDVDGTFRFEGLSPSSIIDVAAIDPTRGMAVKNGITFEVTHASVEIELALPDGVVVHGTVRDPAGRVVPGASAMLWGQESADRPKSPEPPRDLIVVVARSGKDGVYRTLPMPFRVFTLQVGAAGFQEQWKRAPDGGSQFVAPEGVRDVEVDCVLQPAPVIAGSIVRRDGSPAHLDAVRRNLSVIGSEIEPSASMGRAFLGGEGTLDRAEDRYEIVCRLGRDKWVSLWSDNVFLGSAAVSETGDGPVLRVDLDKVPTTSPTAPLDLVVVDGSDGRPVSDYVVVALLDWITAGASGPSERLRQSVHDEAGRVRLASLKVGTYEIEIRAEGYAPRCVIAQVRAEAATAPLRIEVLHGSGSIAGRVVSEDGAPIAKADLCLRRSDGEIALASPECCAKSGDDGTFRFDGVPDGAYFVTAEHQELAPASVHVRGGDDRVLVKLQPGVAVNFRFVENGKPFDGAHWTRILDQNGIPVVDKHRPGCWILEGLSMSSQRLTPGAYSIEAFAASCRSAPTRFEAAPDLTVSVPMVALPIPR